MKKPVYVYEFGDGRMKNKSFSLDEDGTLYIDNYVSVDILGDCGINDIGELVIYGNEVFIVGEEMEDGENILRYCDIDKIEWGDIKNIDGVEIRDNGKSVYNKNALVFACESWLDGDKNKNLKLNPCFGIGHFLYQLSKSEEVPSQKDINCLKIDYWAIDENIKCLFDMATINNVEVYYDGDMKDNIWRVLNILFKNGMKNVKVIYNSLRIDKNGELKRLESE